MHFSNELRLFISNQGSTKHNAIKCCDLLYLLSKHQCEYKHYISMGNTETRLRKYCMICLIRIVLTCEVTWKYYWSIMSNVYVILHWNAGTRPKNIIFNTLLSALTSWWACWLQHIQNVPDFLVKNVNCLNDIPSEKVEIKQAEGCGLG